mgnify:CR=1 FL=1
MVKFKVDENLPIRRVTSLLGVEPLAGKLWIVDEANVRIRG